MPQEVPLGRNNALTRIVLSDDYRSLEVICAAEQISPNGAIGLLVPSSDGFFQKRRMKTARNQRKKP